ncbi:hypothetical protein PsYK624_013640 [Phanerochaete sordida]|uniref:DUF6533 domain-containing protein n=1 Tax=Phanerochaete sordida TaxID=48140 RepID=A0A9P3L7S3_9APHY|nr:hypothetical protein PsYK624_013640 [Phanerochaete sordida]
MASTQPDPTYAALVQAYYSESFSNVAVTCLVVYEFIDTFISEIHLVWKRPVTISAALLGSVRWCMIAGVILSAAASPVTVKGYVLVICEPPPPRR